MKEELLSARHVSKTYTQGQGVPLRILYELDLCLYQGQALCIMGASGAGKSTLLHLLGALDRPTSGAVFYRGQDLSTKEDAWLARFRNEKIGFVFQFHHLLREFTALENVTIPLRIAGYTAKESLKKSEKLLDELGMLQRRHHFPTELSGGESQRVAIARSLIRDPEVLLADEPTGNLDSQNASTVQKIFFELQERRKLSLVVVTHDIAFSQLFPRSLTLKDGRWSAVRGAS